jgi:hypothetical protein
MSLDNTAKAVAIFSIFKVKTSSDSIQSKWEELSTEFPDLAPSLNDELAWRLQELKSGGEETLKIMAELGLSCSGAPDIGGNSKKTINFQTADHVLNRGDFRAPSFNG